MRIHSHHRTITASSATLHSSLGNLKRFIQLESARINYYKEGIYTQYTISRRILTALPSLKLTLLEICFLPRIDTALLRLIAANFPQLETLSLSCTERLDADCCYSCYEQSASRTIFSPIPEYFTDAENLAVSCLYALLAHHLPLKIGVICYGAQASAEFTAFGIWYLSLRRRHFVHAYRP